MSGNDTHTPFRARDLLRGWPADLLLAAGFLTRMPVGHGARPYGDLAQAARAFPLVGLAVGGLAGGVMWLAAGTALGPLACALIGLAAAAWLTGALHEDGLADVADAMGGGSRERRLEIMRDSRIGTYGVVALILAVGHKAAVLSGLPGPGVAWAAFAAAHALSRAVMAPCMAWMAPARTDGLGHGAGRVDGPGMVQALALGGLAALVLLGWQAGLAAIAAAAAAAWVVARLARRRFGGYTGDVLGTVQQAAEVSVLIVVGGVIP